MARKQLGATPSGGQDAATQTSAEALASALVPGVVSDALAENPTITAAALAAVDTAAVGLNLVVATDPRLPLAGDDQAVLQVRDKAGNAALRIESTGSTKIGATELKPDTIYNAGLRVYDTDDQLAFAVNPDGTTFVGDFSTDSDVLSPDVVHVLIGAGQSNMAGAALPVGAETDPPHSRIFMWRQSSADIATATVPLALTTGSTSGLSPLTVMAREWIQRIPPKDVVLLVQGAQGGSQLNTATATNSAGVWNVAYTGASTNLYALLKSATTSALAAAAAKWPGATIQVAGLWWHQGEANLGTPYADYTGWLDAIITDFRTHVSHADLPVVVGGLVPEYQPSYTAPRDSHVDTPKRVVRTGFAEGVANGGGYDTDLVHYAREGCIEMGKRMLRAYDRALLNTVDAKPFPPMTISATLIGGVLTVNWSQPNCRYTSFVPQYSTNAGSSWTTITHTTVATTANVSSVTGPALVRVATVNEVGTSAPSTPVYATGG